MGRFQVAGVFLLVTLAACAPSIPGVMPKSRDVLTETELVHTSATNAYDAVRLHRPMFLATRGLKGSTSSARKVLLPSVYVDGMFFGEAESLRNVAVLTVHTIQYLDAREATLMYGTGHAAGIILVTTKVQ